MKNFMVKSILCFVILLGVLMCSCASKEIDELGREEALKHGINETEYVKILNAYNEYVPKDQPYRLRENFLDMSVYYGEFNRKYVFSVERQHPALKEPLKQKSIGNHAYIYVNDILVYFDSVVYEIEEAYQQQLLSDETIGKICTKHQELFPGLYNVELSPNEDDTAVLQEALEKRYGNMENKSYYHIYFGKYNEYMVFYVPGQLPSVTKKIIAGVEFYCPTSFVLETFKDGEFSTLEEIYKNGKISEEDVQTICELFDGIINLYGKNY